MSQVEPILSREELAALLADPRLASERERAGVAPRRRRSPLARALAIFAEDQSRLAATVHQRPIRFELLRHGSMPVGEFAAGLIDEDRAFALKLAGMPGTGALVIGRSLLFGWLAMAFGAPPSLDVPIPRRAYSRIEARFLRRLAGELIRQLARSDSDALPGACEVGELVEPDLLTDLAAPRLFVASFEVMGLGEPGRLRFGFPETWIQGADHAAPSPEVAGPARSEHFMQMPVEVRAEIGCSRMPVGRLSGLKPGDVFPIDGFAGGEIRVRVAGVQKFTAVRGSVGKMAAIRIL